ncbi:MAG TPA: peptidoglycan DD-metalloendopeptidase family protein [Candidatus Bipolaricaulota bacterium]
MRVKVFERCARAVWSLALLLSMSGCTPELGQVGGFIVDAHDRPVAEVSVWLGNHHTSTDAHGRYSFQDVPPGEYAFVALADGFISYDRVLTIGPGPQQVDVTLQPKASVEVQATTETAPTPSKEKKTATTSAPLAPVEIPSFKLPLPGGYDWLLSTQPGGKFYGGDSNLGHTGKSHFAFDFIDNNRQEGELTGKKTVPILAAADGVVVEVRNSIICQGCKFGYGNYVKLDHGGGFTAIYGHLRYPSVTVRVGQHVEQGQVLGFMGNTGHSTGIHLHFEIRYLDEGIERADVLSGLRLYSLSLSQYQVGSVSQPKYYRSSQRVP